MFISFPIPPPPPSAYNSQVPPFLDALVAKMLAKGVAERPDAGRVHSHLHRVRERLTSNFNPSELGRYLRQTFPERSELWSGLVRTEAIGDEEQAFRIMELLTRPDPITIPPGLLDGDDDPAAPLLVE